MRAWCRMVVLSAQALPRFMTSLLTIFTREHPMASNQPHVTHYSAAGFSLAYSASRHQNKRPIRPQQRRGNSLAVAWGQSSIRNKDFPWLRRSLEEFVSKAKNQTTTTTRDRKTRDSNGNKSLPRRRLFSS